MPNNTIDWGQGAANNSIGWGAGAVNNSLNWGKIHAESYGHDETNLTGTLTFFGQFGTPTVAYSLIDLGNGGAVIQGRRSSDNALQDFTAPEITDGTLLAFAGGNSVFIRQWYDQSGNGNHFIQTSTSAQPFIVSSGTIVTVNSLPANAFNGSTNNMTAPVRITHYPISVIAVQQFDITTGSQISLTVSEVAGGQIYMPWNNSSGNFSYRYGDGSVSIAYGKAATTNQILSSLFVGASGGSYKENNVQVGSAIGVPSPARTSGTDLTIGSFAGGSLFANIQAQALIIYEEDKTSEEAAMLDFINNIYSIY